MKVPNCYNKNYFPDKIAHQKLTFLKLRQGHKEFKKKEFTKITPFHPRSPGNYQVSYQQYLSFWFSQQSLPFSVELG